MSNNMVMKPKKCGTETSEVVSGIRLISADDVKDIICRYINGSLQHTMVYEIEKLNGCISTEEQMLEILGEKEIEFEEE